LLIGPIDLIQKKENYLILSECNKKIHGSQSHINGNIVSLVVYFEVPEGKRREVKRKFNNYFVTILNK
jgi:hypothetical protein